MERKTRASDVPIRDNETHVNIANTGVVEADSRMASSAMASSAMASSVCDMLQALRASIRQQRLMFKNGGSDSELVHQLHAWEDTVSQLQTGITTDQGTQFSLLYEVSQSLNASLDWRHTLQAVMDAVIRITDAERGMLLVTNPKKELQVEITSNATGEPFTEHDLKFSYSIVEQTLKRGSPTLTTNAQIDPRFQGSESIIAYGLRSILCVPLLYQGEPLGVIYLDNRARAGVFSKEDLATLAAFANQAAVALGNAQAHTKTDQALSEKVRELTILQEMARDLNASLNFDRVMERSIAWAIAAASAEAGALGLIAEEGLRWIAHVGHVEPVTGDALRCAYKQTPLLEDKRLILPLLREQRPIGVLYLVANERAFTPNKLEFVTRMADNAAIAVENARLYEALRKANEAKSEFVSIVSHELRTPMTSINGYTDMLSKGMVGELNPQQKEFTEAIRRNVNRMRFLVNDLMDISRIETGRLKLKARPITFKESLDEALHTIQELLDEKQQVFTLDIWPGLPTVHADPNRLTQILINLLTNAIKYTPDKGSIAVRVWLPPEEPDSVRCAIVDSGVGISAEDKTKLFTKFFRVDSPAVQEQQGTGLGLVITKNLVEMQGGRIWVDSEPGKGSSFFFTVPLAMPEAGGLFAQIGY
ncbi:MAG: GAF domain-containing protein [Anaerolineae bacterium]|nr:GAF domain-containing protein [Anaerolineae bacterium]